MGLEALSKEKFHTINTPTELIELVEEIGFLPFFGNEIPGWSVEECTPQVVWFEGDSPWEWRDIVAKERRIFYGKFFGNRTGYISKEWFPHFANYRRDGYDFDALDDEGLVNWHDREIYNILVKHGSCASPLIRSLAPFKKNQAESALTRLQMRTYVLPVDFIFGRDKNGRKYGYGTTVFDTAEAWIGEELCKSCYEHEPEQSYEKIMKHLQKNLPDAELSKLQKLIR